MAERKGQRILLTAAFVLTTQLPGEHDHPSSSTNTPTGTNQPGLPTEVVEQEKSLELTISNLVSALNSRNLNFQIEISVPQGDEQTHKYLCRTGYDACLWYPPRGGNFPGSGDVRLENLTFPLPTGSTITINGLGGGTPRFNHKLLEETFGQFGEAEIVLQDPENFVEGEYLKGGATFSIENDVSTQPQSFA